MDTSEDVITAICDKPESPTEVFEKFYINRKNRAKEKRKNQAENWDFSQALVINLCCLIELVEHAPLQSEQKQKIEDLIKYMSDLDEFDPNYLVSSYGHNTLLMMAIADGHCKVARRIIEICKNKNFSLSKPADALSKTPLMLLCAKAYTSGSKVTHPGFATGNADYMSKFHEEQFSLLQTLCNSEPWRISDTTINKLTG